MSVDLGLSDELLALAGAIGLVDGSGDFDPGWFSEPLTRLAGAVRTQEQREALCRFFDLVLPPTPEPGRPSSEKWHPLLGPNDQGNLYVTLNQAAPGLIVGIAGEFCTAVGATVPASLRVQGDVVAAGSTVDVVVGTTAHPIVVELRVETGFAPPTHPIRLQAVAGRVTLVPDPAHPNVSMQLVLEQLSLDGEPPADTVLDVEELGGHAPDLLAALLKVVLSQTGGDQIISRLADHFLALFGLADSSIPTFPFAEMAQGPGAVQAWLAQVLGVSGTPSAGPWLEHLAGMLGTDVAAAGTGTVGDPWRVTLHQLSGGELYATLALVDGHLRLRLGVSIGGTLGPGQPEVELDAEASLIDVPLNGAAPAVPVPSAAVLVRARGTGGTALVDETAVGLGSLHAGITWDGSALAPTLVLLNNRLGTMPYPRLDLTNVDSVEAAVTSVLVNQINQALGQAEPARRFLAIVGLVPPEDPANPGTALSGWAHHLDLARFAVNPPAAIGAYHRAVLADGDNWKHILREIAELVRLGAVSGAPGTSVDPWTVEIATAGGAQLQLVAWHQPAPTDLSVQQLRVGLRLAAGGTGSTLALVSEVLTFDLPSTGPGAVGFLGAQHLQLVLQPAVEAEVGAVAISLDSLNATVGWRPGDSLRWQISVGDLTLTVDGNSVSVPELHLPPAVPFDVSDLNASAAALGIGLGDLVEVLRLVLVLLAEQAGEEAELGIALLGLHRHLPGLSEESPLLIDPADPGLVLRDPLEAIRLWLSRLMLHVGTTGQPSMVALLRMIGTLGVDLTGEITGLEEDVLADVEVALADLLLGGATFEDPWRVAWPGAPEQGGPDLELWLEPGGPPLSWLAGIRTRAQEATAPEEIAGVLQEIAWFDPALRSLLRGTSLPELVERLIFLETHLASGDGVVPRDSQAPDIFGWVHAIEADAAHHLLPRHPDVVAELKTRIEQLRGANPRTVLLIGPPFGDHTVWADLLGDPTLAGTTDPAAHLDLRVAGIDPRTIALDGLTAVADYYTADLADGDLEFCAAQVAHIAERLAVLHPGPLVIVAHSTAGLVARKYAADHPTRVAGLITIGTPHLGAPLPFLRDPELGDAVRLAGALASKLPASPLRDAVSHLAHAVEGYRAAPSPGALDVPDAYPEAAFTHAAPFDLGDIPVVTISGGLTLDVLPALGTALAHHAQDLAAVPRPDPTHLSYGMAIPVALTTSADAPSADVQVRFGLGQIPLGAAPLAPPRPAQLLRVELELGQEDGWLVGGPAVSEIDGRLRRLQLAVTASAASPGVGAVVSARLDQAAWRGTTVAVAGLDDPRATPLIGAAFARALAGSQGIAASGTVTSAVTGLADALAAIGLVATDATGVTGLSADAFAAMRTDPVGWLGPRIPVALARPGGWAGLVAEGDDGAYRYTPSGSSYGLFARPDGSGWRTGIETTTSLDAPVWVSADVDLVLPSFVPTVELGAHLGVATLRYRTADGTITLDVDPFLEGVVLLPKPTPGQLGAQLNGALPDILATGVLSAVLGRIVPELDVSSLGELLHTPGRVLADRLGALGGGLDLSALTRLLTTLNGLLGLPDGPGIQLPGGVTLAANAGTGTPGSVALGINTTTPIGDVLGLGLAVEIDTQLHASPAGTVTLETPLPGSWGGVTVTFGASSTGLSLVVTPQNAAPITLLPVFSGLGTLSGLAGGLLPRVLDAALAEARTPRPQWLIHALAAATHLDLYDEPGGFGAHTAGFQAMLTGAWFDGIAASNRTGLAEAVVDLLTLVPGLPGNLDAPATGLVRWRLDLPPGQGRLQLAAGWGLEGPTVLVGITDLKPADTPAVMSATVTADADGVGLSLSAGADLSRIGIAPVPRFSLDLDTAGAVRARLLPLSTSTGDGPLVVTLAPAFAVTAGPGTPEALVEGWALPLAVQVALTAAQPVLTHRLWTGGPNLSEALEAAGILHSGQVAHPLPGVFQMLSSFVAAAAGRLDLTLGDLHISLAKDGGRVGLGLRGKQAIPLGDLELDVLFGAPASWGAHAAEGLQVLLLDVTGDPTFDLGVRLRGVGVGLAKSDGTPLVSEPVLRLVAVRTYLFLDLETGTGSLVTSHAGAGVELGGFGLPLSAALGAGGGSNPVASNLLSSGGSGGPHGDAQSVNPAADIDAWYWDDGGSSASLHVLVGGQAGLLWIPIHAGFGPIFIHEVGVGVSDTRLTLAIDGGVSIAGLTAQVDDLSVAVPYATVGDPSTWILDLKGLGIGYSGPAVSIAGGLVKFDGPPIEYDGMLLLKIGNVGAIAIGSYAVVGDGADEYTSLAIFGGVFVPIGIPPIINLTGVALGMGYNRRLVVPEDLNRIPDFMLVRALDRPEALANNPMEALYSFRDQVPPARGALWFAAGLRGTSFELVNVTAVVYVALNNGVEVGLLGVARMALPADDAAIVSVELALKARFSTAEGLFSVQAQLTDNSWLISRDCRLTGGFAFFTWFREHQFLLTLGGYHPSFVPRPEYPVVPRIGYQWNYLGVVHLKGEAYFALTTTAIMTGTRVEAIYGPDWIQVWFTAYTDILVTRDPFHYEIDVGISVGARLRIRVCFFACATIEISVSVGASLHLAGPPFHGTVTADLGVTSVTVPFGDDALSKPPPKHWDEFVALYVKAGDANARSVQAQVSSGLLPAEPAGGPVAPGTAEQPWRLSAEWSFQTETKMPARGFALQIDDAMAESQIGSAVFGLVEKLAGVYDFDLAPMYVAHDDLGVVHRVVISRKPEGGGAYVEMVPDSRPSPADHTFVLRHSAFKVTPLLTQVSEATYHYFPDLKPPAAANTLPVLNGLQLEGIAVLHNQSAVIPIGTLVDATNYRPLPFARRNLAYVTRIQDIGVAWTVMAKVTDGLSDRAMLDGVVSILGGSGTFATLRKESGLREGGYDPVALDAVSNRRTAPPVLSALSEGFTLEDVGRGVAEPPIRVGSVTGVELVEPRLRAVTQRPLLTAATVATPRTTVRVARVRDTVAAAPSRVPVVNVRSDLVTSWEARGLALLRRPADDVPQPTRTARSARSLRSADLGGPTGRATAAKLEELTTYARKGVNVRAGVTQVWELPVSRGWTLVLRGDSAVRVTELSTAGTVLKDREYPSRTPDEEHAVSLRDGAGMVAVTALGRQTDDGQKVEPARGAVSARSTPGGGAVLGWQSGGHAVQVGPTTLLARGAVLRLGTPTSSTVRAHAATTGIVSVSSALAEQRVSATELPTSMTVVGVLVDSESDATLGPQDIVVHVDGGQAAPLPLQVQSGRRTLYLYDVSGDDRRDALVVSAGLTSSAHLAGVLGTTGSAAEWAAALAGSTLTQLVPDEALTPGGSVSMRLEEGGKQHG